MIITLKDLGGMAESLLSILNSRGAEATRDLEGMTGMQAGIPSSDGDFVMIQLNESSRGINVYTISYFRQGTGIPLDVKINDKLIHTKITLKAESIVPGYDTFFTDTYNNIMQSKRLPSTDLLPVRRELERLAQYSADN